MKRVICILLICCFSLYCVSAAVYAASAYDTPGIYLRAGGGSGGGSSGGSSGGGGAGSHRAGSGGPKSALQSILEFILLPVVLFSSSIAFYIKLTKRARRSKRLMKQMKQSDAAWKYKDISETVRDSFYIIQNAWANMDMTPAASYMSDDLFGNFKMKLSWMACRNQKNILEQIKLMQALPVAVHDDEDDSRDFVWFYIKGKMVDYIIDTETLMKVEGSTSRTAFVEYWRFTRKGNQWVLSKILQKNQENQIPFSE